MPVTEVATKIAIFLSEDDRLGHHGLHEAILQRAREEGMAGASVWRGTEGFGSSGHIRTSRFPDAVSGLPLVVELVDAPARIESFLSVVQQLAPGSLVTREEVVVTRFPAGSPPSLDDPVPRAVR